MLPESLLQETRVGICRLNHKQMISFSHVNIINSAVTPSISASQHLTHLPSYNHIIHHSNTKARKLPHSYPSSSKLQRKSFSQGSRMNPFARRSAIQSPPARKECGDSWKIKTLVLFGISRVGLSDVVLDSPYKRGGWVPRVLIERRRLSVLFTGRNMF